MKSCTDIEQSKVLAKILPLESADMYYWCGEDLRIGGHKAMVMDFDIPCWSLAALSEFILPYISDDNGNVYEFYLSKDGLDKWVVYYKGDDGCIFCEEADNMIDVILKMVCWLKKENYI